MESHGSVGMLRLAFDGVRVRKCSGIFRAQDANFRKFIMRENRMDNTKKKSACGLLRYY